MTLREEQDRVQHEILDALKKHYAVALYAAPGFGKGHIISSLCYRAANKNSHGWVLTPQANLINDLHQRFKKWGVPHGVIASNYKRHLTYPIQLICNLSGSQIMQQFDELQAQDGWRDPDFIIIDEADTWLRVQAILRQRFPRTRLVGFSGSPIGMSRAYSHLVLGPGPAELTLTRRLVPVYTHETRPLNLKHLPADHSDYYAWSRTLRGRQFVGDLLHNVAQFGTNRHTLIRTGHRDLAQAITNILNASGLNASYISDRDALRLASMPVDAIDSDLIPARYVDAESRDLQDVIDNFTSTPGRFLVFPTLFDRGTDIPRADTAFTLDPTGSLRVFTQFVGRITRPVLDDAGNWAKHPDGSAIKPFGTFVDMAGWTDRHGLFYHYDAEQWRSLFHATNTNNSPSVRAPRNISQIKKLYKCLHCGCTYSSLRNCPACGAEKVAPWRPAKIVSPETYEQLSIADRARAVINHAGTDAEPVGNDARQYIDQANLQIYRECLWVCHVTNAKPGWAVFLYQYVLKTQHVPPYAWRNADPLPLTHNSRSYYPIVGLLKKRYKNKYNDLQIALHAHQESA